MFSENYWNKQTNNNELEQLREQEINKSKYTNTKKIYSSSGHDGVIFFSSGHIVLAIYKDPWKCSTTSESINVLP